MDIKKARYVLIDGVNYAVPGHIKFVLQCKRGFLYGKERKPEIVVHRKTREWTPEKEVLQSRNLKFKSPWPVRPDEAGRSDWETRVFETSSHLANDKLHTVYCIDVPEADENGSAQIQGLQSVSAK
ncbi:hypothetical protein [Pseudoalteromonas prydzensis]|uniref:hypothetical protein n=1 Tax=Pseudoalteromonas prydzensis TaxID=182141 RepID=UPI003FD148BD